MIRPRDTLVVGVSGGLDSMCLLDLLCRVQERENLTLVVVHVHHGLRGESADRDARLVEERAQGYGLPFERSRIPVGSLAGRGNLQARARAFRYAYFEETAGRWGAQRIATGHHRDDHVETLLMQLFRGTGSFRGIPPVRDERYIRPLIEVGREELLRYAESRAIPFREDASNRKRVYLRNRIRRDLVPWVRERVNPSFDRALIHFSQVLRDEADCLDRLAGLALDGARRSSCFDGVVALSREDLERLDPALRRRVIRMAYARLHGSTYGLSSTRVEEVCRFLEPAGRVPHRRFPLHGGVHLFLEYREVLLSQEDLWVCGPYRYPLSVGEYLAVPEAKAGVECQRVPCRRVSPGERRDAHVALLAWEPVTGGLLIRNARAGDRFRPEGVGGEKKLKDFFIDRKIPRSRRVRLPILEIGGTIAWVAGERPDERFRPRSGDRFCLQVRLICRQEQDVRCLSAGSNPL